jgi:uncharacterized repeat protein (TIGR03843 family)
VSGGSKGRIPSASLGTEEALDLLRRGELRPLGLLPRASNFTFLAEVCDGDRTALAVYKPKAGEAPLWDFPEGTLCRREVAAYRLSKALGWPAVPPTVLRDGPHGPGAVQLFVDADPAAHYFTMRERDLRPFLAVAAFDVVANNADRKSGHCLDGLDGTLWLVDHGVCFAVEPKLRTVIWEFAGDPVPDTLLADVRRVDGELRSGALRNDLATLLSRREVDGIADRASALVRSGTYPHPGDGRPYPWPPV